MGRRGTLRAFGLHDAARRVLRLVASSTPLCRARGETPPGDGQRIRRGVRGSCLTFCLGLLTAIAAPLCAPTASAQTTPTVTLSVPADTAFAEGEGNTTVTVTATLSAAQSAATVIDLSLAGTAKSTDYTVVQLPDITISAGQTVGTADLILRPVDDGFFEGQEMVRIDGAATGVTVSAVDVALEDDETAPSLDVNVTYISSFDGHVDEGDSHHVRITVALVGGSTFESDETVSLAVVPDETLGISSADIDYGTDLPPWSLGILAGQLSATREVRFTVVDDALPEDQEFADLQASVTVAGTTITGKQRQARFIAVSSSDQPLHFSVECTSQLYVEDTLSCTPQVQNGTTDRSYTVTLRWASALVSPRSQVFTIPRGTPGQPSSLEADFSLDAGAAGRQLDYTVTVSPSGRGHTVDSPGSVRVYAAPNPSFEITTLRFVQQGFGPIHTGDQGFNLLLSPSAPRPLEPGGPGNHVEVELDSGIVTVPCSGTLNVIVCIYRVQEGDFDFDGRIEVPAGGVKFTRWRDIKDPTVTGPIASPLPATSTTYDTFGGTSGLPGMLIYGGSTPIDLSVSPQTVQEGAGEQTLTIIAQNRSASAADADLVIPLTFTDISTSAGDYSVRGPLSVTIPAGQVEGRTTAVLFTPTDDLRREDRVETVRIEGSKGAAMTPFVRGAELNILDAAGIALSVSPSSIAEDGGASQVMVTAAWGDTGDSALARDVEVALAWGGTAGAGDYARTGGATVTIPANARSGTTTVTITPTDDNLLEGDETIVVEGSVPGRVVAATELTLTDDEVTPAVTLSVDTDAVSESGAAETIVVSATLDPTVAMANDVTTVTLELGGTATAGTDYSATWSPASRQITIPRESTAGSNTVTLTLTPTDDSIAEGDETVVVQGTATTDMASRSLVVKVATIALEDDDTRGINLAPRTLTVAEDATDTYEVWLGTQPTNDVSVTLSSTDATTATVDKDELTFTTLTWNARQTVTLTGEDDDRNNADDERTASIRHTASGGGYDAVATVVLPVTVTDDDEAASFAIADASVAEGQAVSFTVTRNGATGDAATVSWSTADDATDGAHPASSADDYTPRTTAQTLSFAAGDTSKTITVQTTQDTLDEENETFLVALSSPSTGTSITNGTATGTITDDDAAPELSFGSVAAVDEGAADTTATMSFTVNLSAASGRQVTVDYADAGTGSATADDDYSLAAGTLTFAPGDTSKTFAATVNGDDVDEENETVTVRLSSPVNAGFASGATTLDASGTITDDDTRGITVSAATSGVTVAEADDPGTSGTTENVSSYTVALDSQPSDTVTIDLESGDTDVATVSPSSLEFTTTSWGAKTVTVTGVSDDVKNANDRRTTSITHTVDADDTDYEDETAASVTVTVTDDEAPTVEISGVPAKINSTTAFTATFTFSGAVTGFATGDVTVTGGTKGMFSGTGTTYTLAVTPTGGSNVTVEVAADSASDTVGNTGPESAVSATATWDATAPTVEITGVPAKINSTTAFTATFTFSEAVTEFVTGDVTVTGGTKGAFAGTGASYTLVVTPTGSVDVEVEVAANSATDGLNTGPASAVSATATWDMTAPTVTITDVPSKINSTTAFTATFTFSENVTEFVTGDVTVTGGTKGAFAGTGASYTLAVTPTNGSNVTVEVAANSATDGVNTGPASAVSATATWDAAVPTVEITGVPAKINSTAAFTATFTFSESVTEFVTGDVAVTGGTKGMFSGTGASYTLVVTPTSGSNVTVEVAANSATDGVNTGPASAVSATATWDATAPTVTITDVPSKINSTAAFTATFTFSEDVTEFVTGDVTVTGGTKGAFAGTGASYTLVVTPTSGSNVTVEVAANSATDGVNTGPSSAVSATATWDATAPTVSITDVPSKINSTTAFTATFTFSEGVTEFVTGDVTVTGGTKGAFAGTGASYTLVVTPTGGSNVTVEVAANSATDGVNTGPSSAVSATATWDATAPTVSITDVPSKINSTTAFTATFTFSEGVTEFVTGDVTVTGGTKGAFAGTGASYTLVVTPTGGSNVTVEVAANSATDGVNTGPSSAVSATATWDAAAPTVEITGVPSKINSTTAFTATFTFSEGVTEFVTGDVTVTGGTKGAFAGTGASYTLVVTPTGGSNVTVEVAANSATDGVNTGPSSAVSATATWDAAAPTVEITGVPSKINSTAQFTATFTFSENVTEFVTGDVTVTGGTKGAFAGTGASYTLVVTPSNGSNVTVEVAANSATDGVNTGPASAQSATATWDAAAPTVAITGVPAKINSTTAFTATFTFSEAVTEFVTGDVTVTGGTKGMFSGTGRTYTLAVTPTGGSNVTVEVAANSATDGLNTGPASARSATATWDAVAPTVAIGGVPAKINSTAALTVTFTFSEAVTEFVTGDVTVTGGTKGMFSGSGTSYTLAVTPSNGSNVTVEVAANSATDGVNTGPSSAESATAAWDANAPSVAIGGVPAKINSTAALTVTFTWLEDVTGFETGDVTVTGGTKGMFSGTGASYTLVVTPTSGSNVTVEVAANSATDGVNTGPSSAVSATATWDAAAPTVAITGVPAKINSTAQFTATFTFSENVTEFETGDVTVSGGTKGAFAGTGASYTLAVTPTGSVDVTVEMAANSASDGVNTGPSSAESATATWDATVPTVAITGVPAKINSTAALTVTFTFSEGVTEFATGDVTVTGGTKGMFSGSGASYTLAVTPTNGSNVTVEVAANSATDGVNTGPSSAESATATWDANAPSVAIGGVPAKINSTATLTVTFTFSENVTEFVTGDVTVTGGTKGMFSGSGASYTLAVTPTNGSNVTVEVAANSATDGVNTGPSSAESATATWDANAPSVAIGGVPAKINSTTALTVTFTWLEDVTGFVTGDVTVSGGTKGAFAGTGASYTLAVTPSNGSNVTVEVAANAATDGVNTGPSSAVSATATWDAAVPTVEITGVPAKINSTAQFTATFTFSEGVTEFATGDVTVSGGTKGAFSGTGASYTLVVTPTGGSNVTVEVAANSATDGVNTGPASAQSATATWDAAAPTVAITGVPAKINSTAALTVTFTFSEAVTEFVTGDVTVTGGTKGMFSGSGTTYTLAVTPTNGSNVTVEVAANSATDGGGNTGPASAVSATATWDAAAPTVVITGVPSTINSTNQFTATFTFSENVTGFVTGDVTVTGGTKGAFAGTGASYTLVATPTSGSNVTVEVAANSATDGGGNTGPSSAVSATATWDATAPTVEITGVPSTINSTAQFTATFTFSEDVTGFVTGDVTVTGGTKGAFAGTGASYTLAVTPASGSNVTVEVAANSATDGGGNTGPASAVSATATWDAAAPTVTVDDALATEGDALTFTVTLDQEVSGGLTVTPSFTDGTATKGIDYTENTTALTFAGTAGETQTFTVATTDDDLVEGDETFTVGLTPSGTTETVTATDTGTGTITDDDGTPPSSEPELLYSLNGGAFSTTVPPMTGLAPGKEQYIEVKLSNPTTPNDFIRYELSAGDGFQANRPPIGIAGSNVWGFFEPGTYLVRKDDPADSKWEKWNLDCDETSAGDCDNRENSDNPPVILGNHYSFTHFFGEDNWNLPLKIHVRCCRYEVPLTSSKSPWQMQQYRRYDTLQPISVSIARPSNAPAVLPALSVSDARVDEGPNAELVFVVRLSEASADIVTVNYDPRDVTAIGGEDYAAGGGTLMFNANESEKQVRIAVHDDAHDEGEETMELVLSDASGASIGDGVGVGAIVNSDPMPRAWLGRFGRTVADQALDGIAERIESAGDAERNVAREPGLRGTLGGVPIGGPGFATNGCGSAGEPGPADDATKSAASSDGATESERPRDDAVARGGCPGDRFGFMASQPGSYFTGGAPRIGGFGAGPGAFPANQMQPGSGGATTASQPAGFHGGGAPMTYRDSAYTGLHRLLTGSRFTYTGKEDARGGVLGFWGRGSQTRFDGAEGELGLGGEVTTALLGADYARGDWLVGVALAQSFGDGGYRSGGHYGGVRAHAAPADGGIRTSLTAAIPYASWRPSERLKLWGAAGYGVGDMTLDPHGAETLETDIGWTMAAAGLRSDLFAFAGGTTLALVSDALWAHTASDRVEGLVGADAAVSRLRIGLEGSRRFILPGGGSLRPKIEVGARRDGGDAETGLGVEVGGGIEWTDPRLGIKLELEGRTLVSHKDGDMRDRGFSASFAYDPRPDTDLGLSLALRQDIGGQARGGLDALFADDPLTRRMQGGDAGRWMAEMGYGLSVFGRRFTGTPHLGYGVSYGAREIGVGWRLVSATEDEAGTTGARELSLAIQATRRESVRGEPADQQIGIELRARW